MFAGFELYSRWVPLKKFKFKVLSFYQVQSKQQRTCSYTCKKQTKAYLI